jgi:hypothetical protein
MHDQNCAGHGADQNHTEDEQPRKAIQAVTGVATCQ